MSYAGSATKIMNSRVYILLIYSNSMKFLKKDELFSNLLTLLKFVNFLFNFREHFLIHEIFYFYFFIFLQNVNG